MKKYSIFIVAVFFIMAAALGWFLPVVAFNVYDNFYDGKGGALEIEQIDLKYRDDLLVNQKISIVNYDFYIDNYFRLDKGIYIQENEVKQIVSDFLADFTGYRFDLQKDFESSPLLINLSNNRGTIVIWNVECQLTDGWVFQCFVDDKTGAILKSSFYGDPYGWPELISGYYDFDDPSKEITERFCNSIYKHFSNQISAKLVTHHVVDEWTTSDLTSYRLVFRDDKNYTFEITVNVSEVDGYLTTQ